MMFISSRGIIRDFSREGKKEDEDEEYSGKAASSWSTGPFGRWAQDILRGLGVVGVVAMVGMEEGSPSPDTVEGAAAGGTISMRKISRLFSCRFVIVVCFVCFFCDNERKEIYHHQSRTESGRNRKKLGKAP